MQDKGMEVEGCKAYEYSLIVFSYFIGISWINILKFFRIFSGMRSFIEVIL